MTVATAPRPAFRVFDVTVARIRRLSPSFVRVTFTGDALDGFAPLCLDRRIKLAFPPSQGAAIRFPAADDWYAVWRGLPDAVRPPLRTYTAVTVRPDERELDVDFVVHGDAGVATRWVRRARVGDPLVVVGPHREAEDPLVGIEWRPGRPSCVLLAGDETAVPAIVNIVESLDADARGVALLEVPHAGDARAVAAPSGVTVTWLPRDGDVPGARLSAAVREHVAAIGPAASAPAQGLGDVDPVGDEVLWEVPVAERATPFYAWLAGERSVIAALRRVLVREHGVDRRAVAFMGYWRADRPSDG